MMKSWHEEKYEGIIVQRNLLLFLVILFAIIIIFSIFLIRYVRSARSIEPFVIEIEKKTGVPTVIDQSNLRAYTADEAVKRYFILRYIKAREEYFQSTYMYNYSKVVRVFSSSDVYYKDYRPNFSSSKPDSPYNKYGNSSTRTVELKSIIFPDEKSAQVRIAMIVKGLVNIRLDKVIFLEFAFQNMEMNEEERLINPLGFIVKLYRMDDERQ